MPYNQEELVYSVNESKKTIETVIDIDEKPDSWSKTILYGLQMTLVNFTPFIWASAFVTIAGLPEEILPTLVSTCFIAMGIGTLIQTKWGNKLPLVQGPSASVMTIMGNVTNVFGFAAMWGAVIVGGIIEFLIGASRMIGYLKKFIPPAVIGAVVATIGFVASKIAVTWIFSEPNPINLFLAFTAFIIALTLKLKFEGFLGQGFILISTFIVGIILSTILGEFNWNAVAAEPWFSLPEFFPFQDLEGYGPRPFVLVSGAIIGGFTGYIGSMFESLGDYAAVTSICGVDYKVKHMNKGIAAEGIGCTISGLIGALPVTSYTQNIGIIAATGVASKFVVQIAAVIFILYGLSPKLATLLVTIPTPVIGGVFLITAALIMFSGFDLILSEKRNFTNTVIAGTTLGAAIMIPFFAETTGANWVNSLNQFLQMYLTGHIFIAVTFGIALNFIIKYVLKVDK